MGARIVFACADDGFESGSARGVLGGFDGRDARDLHAYAVSPGDEQLLVSIHEHLHHELQWSTAWGLVAAMSGLLADAGVGTESHRRIAALLNGGARMVHERFATTVSVGVLGVPKGRELLSGNVRYLGYLEAGLALGGPADGAPWQFRESAAQMLLRALMQPRELLDLARRGLDGIRIRDLAAIPSPDRRLELIPSAGDWWAGTFARLLARHPERGGDLGGTWGRVLPRDENGMEAMRAFEETVLIPELAHVAAERLRENGFEILDPAEYLEVVELLRSSFMALAPSDWQVEVLTDRRPTSHEPLGAERERVRLHPTPAIGELHDAGALAAYGRDFLHELGGSAAVLAIFLTGDAYATQFSLADLAGKPPILALAGWPRLADGTRRVPLTLLRPGMPPADLAGMFETLPVVTVTTLSVTREAHFRDQVLALEEVFVLIDLPLNLQVRLWVEDGWDVQVAAIDLQAANGLTLLLFRLRDLVNVWFLAYRSIAGFGELAQLLDRHPDRLRTGLAPPPAVLQRIGMISAWLFEAWWRFQEAENL